MTTTLNQHLNLRKTAAPTDLERETGIEPVSLAWKAKVLPLNYSRRQPHRRPVLVVLVEEAGFEPA